MLMKTQCLKWYTARISQNAALLGLVLTLVFAQNLPAAPVNDNFADRIHLEGTNIIASGSNVGATRERGESIFARPEFSKSVWWSWTALADGVASVSADGSDFDRFLGIYTGETF